MGLLIIMKSKKAQFDVTRKTIFFIIAGAIFSILVLFVWYTIVIFGGSLVEVSPDTIEAMYVYRFLNTPECLAYQDELTGRIDSGLIDLTKFTDGQLYSCYYTNSSEDYNFMLKLKNKNMSIKTPEWWNVIQNTIIKQVRVLDNNTISEDQLFIYVQRKIG
jgi:hypothetical protein